LQKLIRELNAELRAISLLNAKLDSLANQTRSGVDVRQEDQGKAVLVFTIVTVVFMPLSFVTSYLGMNTTDIRNTNSSQTLFWVISAPLTVGSYY
jgi:Mg2+ and Co2+ transporters